MASSEPFDAAEKADRVAGIMQRAQAKLDARLLHLEAASEGRPIDRLVVPDSDESLDLDNRIQRCMAQSRELLAESRASLKELPTPDDQLPAPARQSGKRRNVSFQLAQRAADTLQAESVGSNNRALALLEVQVARRTPLPPSPPLGSHPLDEQPELRSRRNGRLFIPVEDALNEAIASFSCHAHSDGDEKLEQG